ADGIDLLGAEAVPAAEHPQHREVPGAVVAEQEVRAHPHLGHVQPLDEHRPNEHFGIPPRQRPRESHDRGAVHAGGGDRFELLCFGHQQRLRLVGTDDAWRVRIERYYGGRGAALAGYAADAMENLAMPAMDPVEIAARVHELVPARWARVVGEVDYVHSSPPRRTHNPPRPPW